MYRIYHPEMKNNQIVVGEVISPHTLLIFCNSLFNYVRGFSYHPFDPIAKKKKEKKSVEEAKKGSAEITLLNPKLWRYFKTITLCHSF